MTPISKLAGSSNLPILYSFRRCPYAMRARLAIAKAGIQVELREVVLKDKPHALLKASPKATVPVLVLQNGSVIEESFDIVLWAFSINDSDRWLSTCSNFLEGLVNQNDGEFKQSLDGYKYPERNTEKTREQHRTAGERWLSQLDRRLQTGKHLAGDNPSALDIAVMPFVRQFANTDIEWFEASPYAALRTWLRFWIESDLFHSTMTKYPPWRDGDLPTLFP